MEAKKASRTIPSTFRIDTDIHKIVKDCAIEQNKEMAEIINMFLVSGIQQIGRRLRNTDIPNEIIQRLTKVWQ